MCKISVIVPVYNAEEFLLETLSSIQLQSIQDIEIVCVDDGSKDNSAKIIKEKQREDCRIRYEYQLNQGAGVARNRGIEISNGEFIAFMDADDSYPNVYALENLYTAAIENKALVCGGSAQRADTKLDCDGKRVFRSDGYIWFEDYQFDFLFARFIFKRCFVNDYDIRFPNLRIYEDPIFLTKALICAGKFYAINEYVYLCSGSHQVHNMNLQKTKDYLIGVMEELKISSQYQLRDLHRIAFERLEKEASYYVEQHLYSGDVKLLSLLLNANSAIDKNLIGLNQDYVLPPIISLWNAGNNYMKLRNLKLVQWILHLMNK